MDLFDQDEIDQNPVLNIAQDAQDIDDAPPLIGALLVAEGMVTREQLKASLLVQAQDHPGIPLGQIMLGCGYIDERALDRVIELQRDLKSSLLHRIEAQDIPLADLTALVLHRQHRDFICAALRAMGVAASLVRDYAGLRAACVERRPDLILIDSDLIDDTTLELDDTSAPILLLPMAQCAAGRQLPRSARVVVERFVEQVRSESRREDLQERLHQREFELSAIAGLSRAMTAARTPHAAIVKLMITIRDLFGVEAGTLYRLDRATQQLVFEVVLGPHQEALYQQRLPVDRGLAGWVVRNSEPLLIPDVRRDQRFEGMFDHQNGFQTRSVLCVPLVTMGEVRGVLQLINKLQGEFDERDLQLLRIMAALGALTGAFDTPLFERDLGTTVWPGCRTTNWPAASQPEQMVAYR
jgi:putative methionine-R-sulfoxide reductase with GAF domain